jgi:hypothetical protein
MPSISLSNCAGAGRATIGSTVAEASHFGLNAKNKRVKARDLPMENSFFNGRGTLEVVATGAQVTGIRLVEPVVTNTAGLGPALSTPMLRSMMETTTEVARMGRATGNKGRKKPEEGSKSNNPQEGSQESPANGHEGSKDGA